ncbi:forespore capture DNA-binding protein RefZ [Bacillus sp. S/N-304-OC-R1]|uniref:forespore capture DNA-binding protein RefZ n=1 Tax=Bacillus sp. S/N-304-OC-R1 TaxID=2758034 RepID=UPI001C8EBD6F|nr:forespore capture DNA-binding protein RefZ [Bacillus sp. S/N-304-OC-R1]MBY0124107.1 forespore capture DNA-binding protein RefZ [Bacillus sp. S/N-304-OC-R1]
MRRKGKRAIVDAAITLFNANGFDGTSVRDIAKKAKVNPANIAYYFDNKHGLLEYCFTVFFEGYVEQIEAGFSIVDQGAADCLKKITENIMNYQFENMYLTRLILREISLDSQVVREIMSTYLMKERFYLSKVLEIGMKSREFRTLSPDYMILQWKGLLSMPFLNTQYMTEVLHVMPNEKYFAEKYVREIYRWIEGVVSKQPNDETLYLAVK